MPRAYRHRRQEVRNRRRRARRALHQLMLDDEPSLLDEDGAETPLYDMVQRRHGRDRFAAYAASAQQEEDEY